MARFGETFDTNLLGKFFKLQNENCSEEEVNNFMLSRFGEKFTDLYKRFMPDSFVFAFLLTLLTAIASILLDNTLVRESLINLYESTLERFLSSSLSNL